jgi:hypothetical protein
MLAWHALAAVLCVCLPGIAKADTTNRCGDDILKGTYVFSASGFTRAPGSPPGTPWVPKAIVEVIQFDGDGKVITPAVTVANPFGDSGAILSPAQGGAPGDYSIADDCGGTLHFSDANNVTFNIRVEPPRGEKIWLIQTFPANNVFQGTATRVY